MSATRFIPALAGNIRLSSTGWCVSPVHPRARGEHEAPRIRLLNTTGSSPRSRGTFFAFESNAPIIRFIPALAGNMMLAGIRSVWLAVHPRARGEHNVTSSQLCSFDGSSPRSRGTSGSVGKFNRADRFIPAIPSTKQQITVHPRARGEHLGIGYVR